MTGRHRAALGLIAGALVTTALAGCTSSRVPAAPASTVVTGTQTVVTTQTVQATAGPDTATSVAPLPGDGSAPKGEVFKTCPYIKGGLDSEPTNGPNVADIEGDRVGAITVLPQYHPVGCRFYFAYSDYLPGRHEAVADILPFTFATATEARNAMIRTAAAGSNAETSQNFVPGLTGIRYRTRFFGPDGSMDWAFVFVKGTVMVIVHTQQNNTSLNGQLLAAAIAGRF